MRCYLKSRRAWLTRLCMLLLGCCLVVVLSMAPALSRSSFWSNSLSASRFDWDIVQDSGIRSQFLPPSPPAPREALGLGDADEFASFVDGFFEQALAAGEIPGASIAVVKEGEVFFSKGYGYANLATQTPVSADRTLFRVASLSKLFTATATMQLYEQGKLDLADDITQYLDFPINNPYDTPINFAHLMTHTDGSTKRRIGLAAPTAKSMQPLGEYLPDHLPAIVYPPGKLYSYSSHSIALLGYLVERISGLPFADYIQQRILQPLAMTRTTFLQPPPADLADHLAVGYQKANQTFEPVPYLYLNIAPAASLQTTAADMAHFMIAHLQAGRYRQQQILQPETAQLMYQTHFTHYPGLPGTGYGFRDRYTNGLRTIGHLGSLRGYSSLLNLLPEKNIGIFMVTNNFSGIHENFLDQFYDRYFPSPQASAVAEPQVEIDPSRFIGNYRDLEYPRRTMTKVSGLFQLLHVRPYADNQLKAEAPKLLFRTSVADKTLTPLRSNLFLQADGETLTAFRAGDSGAMRYAFNLVFPKIGAYERVPWHGTIAFHLSLLVFCAVFFATAAVSWLIRPTVNQLRGQLSKTEQKGALTFKNLAWPYVVAGLAGLLNAVFLIGLPLVLWLIGGWRLAYGVPLSIVILLIIPIVTAVLAIALLFGWRRSWRRGSMLQRSHYALVMLAAIAFIPFLNYWNLLGFKF